MPGEKEGRTWIDRHDHTVTDPAKRRSPPASVPSPYLLTHWPLRHHHPVILSARESPKSPRLFFEIVADPASRKEKLQRS